MEEILKIVMEYVSIWAPSLVAMLSVVATVLGCLNKTKESFEKLNKNDILKDLNKKLTTVITENEELVRCNKLLLEQITKIKGYSDKKKEE